MKKYTFVAFLATAVIMALSSCSGSGSGDSLLFGSIPPEYAELQEERDKLDEQAKNVTTEAEKAELIKKGKKLEENWTPKLEKAAKELDGKEIPVTDGIFKVTSPVSLTFEKLANRSLAPIFQINGTVETAEPITVENTINPSLLVYIAGYDAEGNDLYHIKVGRITGDVKLNVLEIPAGTPVEFSTLTFDGTKLDQYPETKTIKFIYI